jgi:hypothetical protein
MNSIPACLEHATDRLIIDPGELGLTGGELGTADGGDSDLGLIGELLRAPANERSSALIRALVNGLGNILDITSGYAHLASYDLISATLAHPAREGADDRHFFIGGSGAESSWTTMRSPWCGCGGRNRWRSNWRTCPATSYPTWGSHRGFEPTLVRTQFRAGHHRIVRIFPTPRQLHRECTSSSCERRFRGKLGHGKCRFEDIGRYDGCLVQVSSG